MKAISKLGSIVRSAVPHEQPLRRNTFSPNLTKLSKIKYVYMFINRRLLSQMTAIAFKYQLKWLADTCFESCD